jgi:hypothetical protein
VLLPPDRLSGPGRALERAEKKQESHAKDQALPVSFSPVSGIALRVYRTAVAPWACD